MWRQYAHVLTEITDTRRDGRQDEVWLHATITYVLLRQPSALADRAAAAPANT